MTRNNTPRRQQVVASLKSAIATAAVLGTISGWIAFGGQQSTEAVAAVTTTIPATSEVVSTTADQSLSTTQSQSSTAVDQSVSTTSVQASTSQSQPITRTHSSK